VKATDRGCIVADMTMPGLSVTAVRISLDSSCAHLPLIFLTGEDSEESRAAARGAGAAAYFRKPVDIHALLDAIQWAIHGGSGTESPRPGPAT
jgi:FixJ family two-component response regulator